MCVLSIDGDTHVAELLASAALVRLEAALQRCAGNSAAWLADLFDAAASTGGATFGPCWAMAPPYLHLFLKEHIDQLVHLN